MSLGVASISAGVAHASLREELLLFQLLMGPGGVGTGNHRFSGFLFIRTVAGID